MTIKGLAGSDAAGAALVILDGGFPAEGDPVDQVGMDRIFEIHPNAGAITIENLTMREGYSTDDGAAIQNWSKSTLTIKNVTFHRNYASAQGGAINHADPEYYDWTVQPLVPPRPGRIDISDSRFTRNYAGGGGAAINNQGEGTITILRTKVTDNPGPMVPDPEFVPDPTNPHEPVPLVPGPGVFEPESSAIENQAQFDTIGTIKIIDSFVERNTAGQDGAGVKNQGSGTIILERTDVKDNVTNGGNGGGVFSAGGTRTITGGTISGNDAAAAGGGIATEGEPDKVGLRGSFTITGTTVSRIPAGATAAASRRRRQQDRLHRRHHLEQHGRRRRRRVRGRRPVELRWDAGDGEGEQDGRRGRRHLPREREAVDPERAERPDRGRDQGPARHHHDRRARGQGLRTRLEHRGRRRHVHRGRPRRG